MAKRIQELQEETQRLLAETEAQISKSKALEAKAQGIIKGLAK